MTLISMIELLIDAPRRGFVSRYSFGLFVPCGVAFADYLPYICNAILNIII